MYNMMQKRFKLFFETRLKWRRGGVGNIQRVVKSHAISFE